MDHWPETLIARLKGGPRLTIGFALVVGLMLAGAVIAVPGLHALNGNLRFIVENRHTKTEQLQQIIDEVNAVSVAVRNALLADEGERAPHLARVDAGRETPGPIVVRHSAQRPAPQAVALSVHAARMNAVTPAWMEL